MRLSRCKSDDFAAVMIYLRMLVRWNGVVGERGPEKWLLVRYLFLGPSTAFYSDFRSATRRIKKRLRVCLPRFFIFVFSACF
jgi:hypothetical protein